MKRFRVQISGENFLLDLDGDHGKFGFKATRTIKATDQKNAEKTALILIHHELNQSDHIIKNTPDAPRVYVTAIEELKFYQFSGRKNLRFEFFSEES
jgi:hypothetical protein